MRESNQVFSEWVILTKLSPVVHQYTWMSVVPALQGVPGVEHPLPIMVAWHYQHVHRRGLRTHIHQLHQKFAAFAEGLLPAGVLDLASPIYRRLPCPID